MILFPNFTRHHLITHTNDIFEGKIKCHFLYGRPESFVGDIKFREMFSQQYYRQNIVAVVCDEVHTVVLYTGKKL